MSHPRYVRTHRAQVLVGFTFQYICINLLGCNCCTWNLYRTIRAIKKFRETKMHSCLCMCASLHVFCCVPSYLKTCTFIPYKVSPNIFFEYPKITGCARLIPSTHSYTETVDFYILPVSLRPVVLHRFALPGPSLKRSVKGGQDNPGF